MQLSSSCSCVVVVIAIIFAVIAALFVVVVIILAVVLGIAVPDLAAVTGSRHMQLRFCVLRWNMTPQGTGAMGQKLDSDEACCTPFRGSPGVKSERKGST